MFFHVIGMKDRSERHEHREKATLGHSKKAASVSIIDTESDSTLSLGLVASRTVQKYISMV